MPSFRPCHSGLPRPRNPRPGIAATAKPRRRSPSGALPLRGGLLALALGATLLARAAEEGSPEAGVEFTPITEFTIRVPERQITDLNRRLALRHTPGQLAVADWTYGTDLDYLNELLNYWEFSFDWPVQQSLLNSLSHFVATVDQDRIHFIHEYSVYPNAIPLLLLHGWPSSFAEFAKIIPQLTQPAAWGGDIGDGFHVVVPSLPGFGFSSIPSSPGYGPERIALMLANLMEQLGYERYGLAGGDWGALINQHLANHYPERIIGLHSNMLVVPQPEDPEVRALATEEELALRNARIEFMRGESAYQQLQATKPQTLAYGLTDSPTGLAAWILEKFHSWTDLSAADGDLEAVISKDELLTNIAIYWFTGTITSSMRIYYENQNTPPIKPMGYIDVPTGVITFPKELYVTPRAWAETAFNIQHWTVAEKGGHFPALEQPGVYLNDLRDFFRPLREAEFADGGGDGENAEDTTNGADDAAQ